VGAIFINITSSSTDDVKTVRNYTFTTLLL